MGFIRTNSGVSNLRLFYDAEMVIFTEGGTTSFSTEDVEEGKFNRYSVDIKFWNNVLKAYGFAKKVQFRAVGSKTSSNKICEKIINKEIRNTAVAKDRDLDQFLGYLIDSPLILYTKGYSWENDVFVKDFTLAQLSSMVFEENLPEEIRNAVELAYQDFRVFGKNLVKLELIFRRKGIPFITDLKGERFFNSKNSLTIDKTQVTSILETKKKELVRPIAFEERTVKICPFLNNYGKLLEALSVTIISHFCKKHAGYQSVPKQVIVAAMIERFANKLKEEKDQYYCNLVDRLKAE